MLGVGNKLTILHGIASDGIDYGVGVVDCWLLCAMGLMCLAACEVGVPGHPRRCITGQLHPRSCHRGLDWLVGWLVSALVGLVARKYLRELFDGL